MSELHNTLLRKAARLLVVRMGSNMPPPRRAEVDAEEVIELVKKWPIAGLILFNGAFPLTRDTLTAIQREAQQPLLVMTDAERGLGQQMHGATVFPHIRSLGEIEDITVTKAVAEATAREALANGVQVVLAPVADVNRNPKNPIIANRAFGESASEVAIRTEAHVRGIQSTGAYATAKHFPGHGNTARDSHAELPIVQDSREEILKEDMPPFISAISADVGLIMTAHVAYPALDPSGRPATLSYPILTELLRHKLGFKGVVISDSLHMEGIKQSGKTEGQLAVQQVLAGVDLLLDPQNPEEIIREIARAVESGELSESRLDEAIARTNRLVDGLDNAFGDRWWKNPQDLQLGFSLRKHEELSERVAKASIRASGEIPLVDEKSIIVMLRTHTSPFDPPELPLIAEAQRLFGDISCFDLHPGSGIEQLEEARRAAAEASAVVLALVVKPAAWHAFGLPENLAELALDISRHPATVTISLGDARALDFLPNALPRIVTFSDVPVSQREAVRLLHD